MVPGAGYPGGICPGGYPGGGCPGGYAGLPVGGIPLGGALSWFFGAHAPAKTKMDARAAQVESVRMKSLLEETLACPKGLSPVNKGNAPSGATLQRAPPLRVRQTRMPRDACAAVVVAGIALAAGGCARHEPPAPDASPTIALPEIAPTTSSSSGAGSLDGGTSPRSTAAPSAPSSSATPPASSANPSLLPQTHDRPEASGAAFEARVAALWSAVVSDDAEK